jgi:hypothetical protein
MGVHSRQTASGFSTFENVVKAGRFPAEPVRPGRRQGARTDPELAQETGGGGGQGQKI